MKALTWHSKGDVRCRDAIIKVTACAICADLHIFDGVIPSMESGDVLAASLRVAQSDGHPEADPRILLALSLTRRLSTRTTRAPLAPAEQYWVAGAF